MIPLVRPLITDEDIQAVTDVLRSGHLVQGRKVQEFEEVIAAYVGTKYAIAVSSGTAALHLALLSIGIKQGDFVIVPAYSFPATANVVKLCGATPLFCDIDRSFSMDTDALEDLLIKSGPKVEFIMPVHCFGLMADMQKILNLGWRYGIQIIEDAACALGSSRYGRTAGSCGEVACFSFHPLKLTTTGEGGMITTDNSEIVSLVRAYRDHGRSDGKFEFPGFNYRMTEFQAALGLSQFKRLDSVISDRKRIAEYYDSRLSRTIEIPIIPFGYKWNAQSYVVKVDNRDQVRKAMLDKGIETSIGTYNIPRTLAYRHSELCPVTDIVASQSLGLPMYEGLTLIDQEYVAKTLLEAVNG